MTLSKRNIFLLGVSIVVVSFSSFLYYDTKDYRDIINKINTESTDSSIHIISKNNDDDYKKFSSCTYSNNTTDQNNFKTCILEKAPTVRTALGAYLFTQSALMYLNNRYDDKDIQELAKLTLKKGRQYIKDEAPIHSIMSANIAKAHNKSLLLVAIYGKMNDSPLVNLMAEIEEQLNSQEVRILHPEIIEEKQQKIREAVFSPII